MFDLFANLVIILGLWGGGMYATDKYILPFTQWLWRKGKEQWILYRS